MIAERNGGYNYVYKYTAFADGSGKDEWNFRIAERLAKTILWVVGGYKISVSGSKKIYEGLKKAYTADGARAFDVDFMSGVYEKPFEVVWLEKDEIPAEKNCSLRVGGYLKGCRIGFDAGRKRPKSQRGNRRKSCIQRRSRLASQDDGGSALSL